MCLATMPYIFAQLHSTCMLLAIVSASDKFRPVSNLRSYMLLL